VKADPFVQLRLLDLQALDSALARLAHRRRTLPELAEIVRLDGQVDGLRDGIVLAETELSDLAREQARFEREIDQVRTRKARDEERMASGAITNPKQLQDMEHEVATLTRRQSDLEDGELEVMEKVETIQGQLDELVGRREGYLSERAAAEQRRDDRLRRDRRRDRAVHGRAGRDGSDVPRRPAGALREDPRERGRRRRRPDRAGTLRRLPPGPDEQREGRHPRGRRRRRAAARGVRPDHGAHRRVRHLACASSWRPTAGRAATPARPATAPSCATP
jgi:hypothetical protein